MILILIVIMRLMGAFDPGLLKSSLKLGQSWAHDCSGADERMILIVITRLMGAFHPGLLKSSLKLGQIWAHDRSGADERMIVIMRWMGAFHPSFEISLKLPMGAR